MSDEVNDNAAEIKRLTSENTRLQRENAALEKSVREADGRAKKAEERYKKVNDTYRDRRHDFKQLTEEKKALEEKLKEVEAERDQFAQDYLAKDEEFGAFKAQAEAEPNALLDQIKTLTTNLRTIKHETAYEKAAKALKVSDPTKFKDLLALARHEPDGDDPDDAKIAEVFS